MTRTNVESIKVADHCAVAPFFSLNDVVKIETAATGNRCLIVAEARQYSGGPHCPMVDYLLVRNPPGTPPMRLRVMPSENGASTHRILVLTLYDELAFNEGLLAVVRDDTKRLVTDDGSKTENHAHDEFWRVNDRDDSHINRVAVRTGDGKTDETTIEFWDFSRLIDIDGVETEEFVFVEMNKESGWFQTWRGIEVASGKIEVV